MMEAEHLLAVLAHGFPAIIHNLKSFAKLLFRAKIISFRLKKS